MYLHVFFADEHKGHQQRKNQYQGNQTALGKKDYPEQCCNYTDYNMLPNTKMEGELTIFHL